MQQPPKIAGLIIPILYSILLIFLLGYPPNKEKLRQTERFPIPNKVEKIDTVERVATEEKPKNLFEIRVQQNVPLRVYFDYMDSLVCQYDSLLPYPLDEHLLVRANDWIIDTLENTDYYHRMEKGEFVFDQRDLIILKKGDTLQLPDVESAAILIGMRSMVTIDLNIPELSW